MTVISTLIVDITNFLPNLVVTLTVNICGLFIANRLNSLVNTVAKSLLLISASVISNLVFCTYQFFDKCDGADKGQCRASFDKPKSCIVGEAVVAFALPYGLDSRPVFTNIIF